jgi:hypothetical protein
VATLITAIGAFAALIGLMFIAAALIGLPVMLLWNWLLPELFGLKAITFWQAVGLSLLSGMLFKANISVKS